MHATNQEREGKIFVDKTVVILFKLPKMKERKQYLRVTSRCRLGIQSSPLILDPSEFTTILVSSMRSLFGEMESHSANIKVSRVHDEQDEDYQFIVECDWQSLDAIRSSLTMVTTPSYLKSTIYRFDTHCLE